ncbi:MauE/DoxX family redox-associated membrane protein [Leptolyngbya sp. FACHB-261]|uniref:MauE/DoxX family redox-associated membrane protein n=1 Tax=Leptolyngbya sp. FACHB-261 TaxID=2692806 RepID=UPI001681FABC|nr:MauE/DoxX family redox-associated membrane protein [Leptolyngbya sp. FACHB-261]MBD2100442.1 DoxX protein [Leptolyngbya sp. FACHB-261]
MAVMNHEQSALLDRLFSLKTVVTTTRILLGVFFILSAIANTIHFYDQGGILETLTTAKLRLWGFKFEGIGPLPALLSLPYAYLLSPVELAVGFLFLLNRWVRWAGLVMMLLLFSFLLAFGFVGPDGLFPNNAPSFDKNFFLLTSAWFCAAYDHYLRTKPRRDRLNAADSLGSLSR